MSKQKTTSKSDYSRAYRLHSEDNLNIIRVAAGRFYLKPCNVW